jgi:hypothetical protein
MVTQVFKRLKVAYMTVLTVAQALLGKDQRALVNVAEISLPTLQRMEAIIGSILSEVEAGQVSNNNKQGVWNDVSE